jgi:phasin
MRETNANSNTKAGATKPAGSPFDMPKMEAPQALRQFAENGAAHAQQTYAKMSAATTEASNLIHTSCETAAKGAMEYNAKVLEIACANTNAAFDYARDLSGVRSPSQFLELTTEHARKRFDVFSTQAKELAALGQKVASEAVEPLKAGAAKAFRGHVG